MIRQYSRPVVPFLKTPCLIDPKIPLHTVMPIMRLIENPSTLFISLLLYQQLFSTRAGRSSRNALRWQFSVGGLVPLQFL
jgi:hypothetical protein